MPSYTGLNRNTMNFLIKIIFITIVFCIGYNLGSIEYVTIDNKTIILSNKTWNPIGYLKETRCINVTNQINKITVFDNDINYINITVNMTPLQYKRLKNIKPDQCMNIGCSEGFIRAKYMAFDVFGIPHPKFSEKPSSGAEHMYDVTNYSQCMPIYKDKWGYYMNISRQYWQFDQFAKNFTFINGTNITEIRYFMGNQTDNRVYYKLRKIK